MAIDNADMQEFARLLDAALQSDNPSVKKALQHLMLITAIAEPNIADDQKQETSPGIFERLDTLVKSVAVLEQQLADARVHIGNLRCQVLPAPTRYGKLSIPSFVLGGAI